MWWRKRKTRGEVVGKKNVMEKRLKIEEAKKKPEWGSSNNIYKHLSIDPKLNLFFSVHCVIITLLRKSLE